MLGSFGTFSMFIFTGYSYMVKGEKAFFTVSDRSDHKMPGLMVFIQGTAEGVKGGEVTFIKQVSSPVFHILYISFL